jgi:MarR family transcriptional regulator, lower aerobic nicotinate degradation pathway regulator
MPVEQLYAQPGHLILRCQQIAVAIFAEETSGHDITPVQFAALFTIREHPGLEQATLARLIAFDRSTVGSVIDRLEEKKFVLRKTAKHDRRANLLYATDAGEAMLKAVTGKVARAQVRMLEHLSPRERKMFIKMMMRLVGVDEATDLSILNAAAE